MVNFLFPYLVSTLVFKNVYFLFFCLFAFFLPPLTHAIWQFRYISANPCTSWTAYSYQKAEVFLGGGLSEEGRGSVHLLPAILHRFLTSISHPHHPGHHLGPPNDTPNDQSSQVFTTTQRVVCGCFGMENAWSESNRGVNRCHCFIQLQPVKEKLRC